MSTFPKALFVPDRTPYRIPGPARVLVLPDVHIPYHDKNAIEIALDWGAKWKPTHILLNGDWVDFYAISFFQRDPRLRDLQKEIELSDAGLKDIRKRFPRVKIILKAGNHEARWRSWLWTHAPELAGVPRLSLESLLSLDTFKVEMVPSLTQIRLGKLVVIHGHEYRWGAIANPVNPARGLYLKTKTSALCSHHHQVPTRHSDTDAMGHLTTTWATGCLCHLSPDYNPMNNWGHGFAAVEIGRAGEYDVMNARIYKGKVWQ